MKNTSETETCLPIILLQRVDDAMKAPRTGENLRPHRWLNPAIYLECYAWLGKGSKHARPTCVWVDRQTRSTVQNVIIHRVFPRAGTFLMNHQ